MSLSSDDEDSNSSHHRPTSSSSVINGFEDAFSDTDDYDVSFEFSPAAIRADLAKNLNHVELNSSWDPDDDMRALAGRIGLSTPAYSFGAHNGDEQQSPPTQQPPSSGSATPSQPPNADSLDDINLNVGFSSISLHSPQLDGDNGEEHVDSNSPRFARYPITQTNASEEHVAPSVGRADTPSVSSVRSHSSSPPQEPDPTVIPLPITPNSSNAMSSAVSLSIPASASLPTPSSSHEVTAINHPSQTKHRPTRSAGPSMLDKVVSKTRPKFLPPKDRAEDKKHMADWETMMKRSRAAEDKRRKALQERRFARERRIDDSLVQWERDIVPDWRVVNKDHTLRKVWWQGIPTKLRATMWQNAVGNELALSKDAFKACMTRANRALSSGSFPTAVLDLIEDDIKNTLPSLHLFMPGTGPLYQDLKDMLCAWVVARSDEGLGYVRGVAKISAMILLNMESAPGFIVLRNLLERHCMRSFYGGISSKDDVEAYYRIFDTLLADGMPKIYFNFKQHQISPAEYLPDWLISLFLDHLPFEACARLWDILLLEGDSFLFRASLGILAALEPRLFFPDRQELLELLKGENRAALEVAKRDGRVLNGAKYDIYGVDEETLWERLDEMEDWWRESTWTRLIQRELPDL